MLERTNASVQLLSDRDLLEKMRATPIGRELQQASENKLKTDRRAAEDLLLTESSRAADEIERIEADIALAEDNIGRLADELLAAQKCHGELNRQKLKVVERRMIAMQKARSYLLLTAPRELVELADLARRAMLSAKFQLRQTFWPNTFDRDEFGEKRKQAEVRFQKNQKYNRALFKRASEVMVEVNAQMCRAEIDLGTVDRLRNLLDAPKELVGPDKDQNERGST